MANEFYSKGTIKVKNADGVLVPFLPVTDFSCISDQSNAALPQIISNMEAEIVEAENSGGIELMYDEEPTEENTATFNNETMIAVIEQENWTFTVDTTKLSPENTYTGVPFNYHGISGTAYRTGFSDPNPISITVDWGDGTKSKITVADLSSSTNSSSTEAVVHSYDNPGVYNVKVSSDDWERIYISTGTGYAYDIELHDTTRNIYYFIKTLTRLTSSIPKIKGTVKPNYWDNYTNVRYWTRTDNTFYGFFCGCSALTYISEKLFAKNSQATSFIRCFAECSAIENLPERLFNPCINAEIFTDCFYKCTSLRHIPERLFKRNTAATSFADCFSHCDALEAIPEGLFAYNASAASFSSCFEYCKALQSIPKRLFYNNLEAVNFRDCFYYCTSLESIPSGLFDKNTAAANFYGCFQYCSKIKAIPEHLFDNNTAAASFHQCFAYSSVESIPTDLFKHNPAVTDFGGCFANCKIASIPEDLFRYNPEVIAFGACFSGCTGLTSIPEDLFRYNVNVGVGAGSGSGTRLEHFNACFSGCTGLTSIPENLFRYNGSVGSFWETFKGCSRLGAFTLYITSRGVATASDFVTKNTGVARTIHVPAGSTTKGSFDNVASTLGLTIIGD